MASMVLPKVLSATAGTPAMCPTKNLAFSTIVSSQRLRTGVFIPGNLNLSRTRRSNRHFLVRAEEGAKVEVEFEEETVDENELAEDGEIDDKEAKVFTPRVKLGDIMGILNKRAIEVSDNARPIPDLRTGDIVEIKLEVPENRRRLSVYKGIVISKQNAGIHTTIRIRRVIAGVGVEIVFPIYSPNIKEIKVVNHRKVRRARLYYLRDKLPRLSTFK